MSGTYTIGGSSPDYATFTDAVNALTTEGVSGPVVFNVRSGQYDEAVTLPAITGASATNTITFQAEGGDSSLVTLSNTVSGNYVIQLNGGDYFIFRHLTLDADGSVSMVVDIQNGSDHNQFLNNHLIGSGASYVIHSPTSNSQDQYNHFENNRIEFGGYGFYYRSNSSGPEAGTVIRNNILESQSFGAMYLRYQRAADVSSNTINAVMDNVGFTGIQTWFCDSSMQILKNKISITVQTIQATM